MSELGWTDERVELLKKLWADGLSSSQIANELGGITRNAVIGKVHRLGLSGRPRSGGHPRRTGASAPRPPKTRSNRRLLRVSRPAIRGDVAVAYDYDVEPEQELMDIPEAQRKSLMQLDEHTCHWPVGNPGSGNFYFCGGESASDLPYCAYHCRVAYQPASERRRDIHRSYNEYNPKQQRVVS